MLKRIECEKRVRSKKCSQVKNEGHRGLSIRKRKKCKPHDMMKKSFISRGLQSKSLLSFFFMSLRLNSL